MFQHLKIDFSTLNPGGLFTSLFGLFTSLRLVKYKPACKQAAGLEWLGRSDFEPGCLSSLVRRRWFALRGTRVQAPASPSPKILQKSSRSEKTRGPGDAPARLHVFLACLLVLRPVYCIFWLVYWLSGLFTCLGASASVLSSPVKHSEVLSGAFAVSLWALLGLEPRISRF